MHKKKEKQLIVIGGPTASGKTAIAVELGKILNAPVVSADSRQFYKEMAIGTAKPTIEEMQGVPHYFIDSHSIHDELSAGRFADAARIKIIELFEDHDYIIVVGGSGLFIHALLHGIDELPGDKLVREKWNKCYQDKGITYLQEKLKSADPVYFEEVDQQNHTRLIRALEVIELTGIPFSLQRTKTSSPLPCKVNFFVVNHTREKLYQRINQRVIQMINNGLIDEVIALKAYRNLQSLNTVGYKEALSYLDDEISLERAIELIQQNSRRYAKRQLTWFRGVSTAIWLENLSTENAVSKIIQRINTGLHDHKQY